MKYFLLSVIGVFLFSCGVEKEDNTNVFPAIETSVSEITPEQEPEVEEPNGEPGTYKEFHEDGSLKIEGRLNKDSERTGLWISYYPDSTKWSESYYVKGKRDGHSVTFYETGGIRYVGEYRNDKQVGEWKFYDEKGEETEVKNYDSE